MVSHIGISNGTDMIFGGIGHKTIHSTIGIIGTMDGLDMVTLSIMDTDIILTDGIIQTDGLTTTKELHTILEEKIKTSHIT